MNEQKRVMAIAAGLALAATIVCLILVGVYPWKGWATPASTQTSTAAEATSTDAPPMLQNQSQPPASTPTDAPAATLTPTLLPSEIIDSKGVGMRYVPPGVFIMGSDSDNADERPAHEVYLDGYYMDTFEVTNARYRACVNAWACEPPKIMTDFNVPAYDNYPVVYVDWDMAKAYCEWRDADLPTEAQWEKAARGTDGRYYPWGAGINCNLANSSGCVGHLVPVGSYPRGVSPYGLFDMAGNVSEWVLDWYLETYYQISPFENPLGPDTGIYRVIRDGTFEGLDIRLVRTTIRSRYDPTKSADHLGFRCARPEQ
ncbi:MAG: SUMF1/EgtB/PvdO family nonheme iron enzyme [Chloroflexota bacterium]